MEVCNDGRGDKQSQGYRAPVMAFLVALEAECATQETILMSIRIQNFLLL